MSVLRSPIPMATGLLCGIVIGFFAVTFFLQHRAPGLDPISNEASVKSPNNSTVPRAHEKSASVPSSENVKTEVEQYAGFETEQADLVRDIIGPDLYQNQESVTAYAEQYGVSEAEATHRLRREGPLSLALHRIAQLEADNVAGWDIDRHYDFRGRITLVRGSTLKPASQEIVNANSDIDVFYDADYSLARLEQAYEQLSVYSAGLGQYEMPAHIQDAIAFTEIDMRANALTVSLQGDSESWESDEAMVAEAQGYLLSIVDVPLNFLVLSR